MFKKTIIFVIAAILAIGIFSGGCNSNSKSETEKSLYSRLVNYEEVKGSSVEELEQARKDAKAAVKKASEEDGRWENLKDNFSSIDTFAVNEDVAEELLNEFKDSAENDKENEVIFKSFWAYTYATYEIASEEGSE